MATNQRTTADYEQPGVSLQTTADSYLCPECDGALASENGVWGCSDCHYVPPHSAD